MNVTDMAQVVASNHTTVSGLGIGLAVNVSITFRPPNAFASAEYYPKIFIKLQNETIVPPYAELVPGTDVVRNGDTIIVITSPPQRFDMEVEIVLCIGTTRCSEPWKITSPPIPAPPPPDHYLDNFDLGEDAATDANHWVATVPVVISTLGDGIETVLLVSFHPNPIIEQGTPDYRLERCTFVPPCAPADFTFNPDFPKQVEITNGDSVRIVAKSSSVLGEEFIYSVGYGEPYQDGPPRLDTWSVTTKVPDSIRVCHEGDHGDVVCDLSVSQLQEDASRTICLTSLLNDDIMCNIQFSDVVHGSGQSACIHHEVDPLVVPLPSGDLVCEPTLFSNVLDQLATTSNV